MKLFLTTTSIIVATSTVAAQRNPCTTYEDLDFTSCDIDSIKAVVQAELDVLPNCRNNVNQEMKALTKASSNSDAKPIIIDACLLDREPCLPSGFDDNSIEFTTCDLDNVIIATEIALNNLDVECNHDAKTELMILTDTSDTPSLRQDMRMICQGNQVACLSDFTEVEWTMCDLEGARAAVDTALNGSCAHDAVTEIKILTNHRFDSQEANDAVKVICNENKGSCLEAQGKSTDDVIFTACDMDTIKESFESAIGDTCTHDAAAEIRYITGETVTKDANNAIKEICQANRIPCIQDITGIFEWTTTCSKSDIADVINATLAAVDCPHNFKTEIGLHTQMEFPASRDAIAEICQAEIQLCVSWENVALGECDQLAIADYIEENMPANCPRTTLQELQILTGANSIGQTERYLKRMCRAAWNSVTHSRLSFGNDFLSEYNAGGTYLNSETGNFQGDALAGYPTSAQSQAGGEKIKAFYDNGAENSILRDIDGVSGCEYQAMMCCFSRDRQGGDDNGNCEDNNCDDADPADNSDLCGREDEGDIHCHGVAWGEDENDVTAQFMFNNWFYVSMYDHLYQRGYVEKVIDAQVMCGCIEEMPVVSRADCTQTDVTVSFAFGTYSNNTIMVQSDDPRAVDVAFNECQGAGGNNNDLQAYTEQLVEDDKMDSSVYQVIRETLQGADDANNCIN